MGHLKHEDSPLSLHRAQHGASFYSMLCVSYTLFCSIFYKYISEYCLSTTLSTHKAHALRCYQGHINGENSPHYFQEKRGCLEKNFPTLEKLFSCLEKIFSRHGKKISRRGNYFENVDGAKNCFLAQISGMVRGFFRRMRTIIKPPV